MDSEKETLQPFSDVKSKHCWLLLVCHLEMNHFDKWILEASLRQMTVKEPWWKCSICPLHWEKVRNISDKMFSNSTASSFCSLNMPKFQLSLNFFFSFLVSNSEKLYRLHFQRTFSYHFNDNVYSYICLPLIQKEGSSHLCCIMTSHYLKVSVGSRKVDTQSVQVKGMFCQSQSGASVLLPRSFLSHYFQRSRVTDQFVQSANKVWEARTRRAVFLPAVQHQLVQVGGTIRRRGQPVVLFDGIDDLTEKGWMK